MIFASFALLAAGLQSAPAPEAAALQTAPPQAAPGQAAIETLTDFIVNDHATLQAMIARHEMKLREAVAEPDFQKCEALMPGVAEAFVTAGVKSGTANLSAMYSAQRAEVRTTLGAGLSSDEAIALARIVQPFVTLFNGFVLKPVPGEDPFDTLDRFDKSPANHGIETEYGVELDRWGATPQGKHAVETLWQALDSFSAKRDVSRDADLDKAISPAIDAARAAANEFAAKEGRTQSCTF